MNKSLAMVFGIFLIVILGSSFLTIIADRNSVITTPITITNETLDITSGFNATDFNTAATFNLTYNDWVDSSISILNGTDTLTEGTDFNVDYTTEAINFSNTSAVWTINASHDNNAGVNYQYYDADYLTDTTSRTLIGLIALFFAIGILALVYWRLKDGAFDNLLGK